MQTLLLSRYPRETSDWRLMAHILVAAAVWDPPQLSLSNTHHGLCVVVRQEKNAFTTGKSGGARSQAEFSRRISEDA